MVEGFLNSVSCWKMDVIFEVLVEICWKSSFVGILLMMWRRLSVKDFLSAFIYVLISEIVSLVEMRVEDGIVGRSVYVLDLVG